MPVVVPPTTSTSSAQNVTAVTVFDYEMSAAGLALVRETVDVWLDHSNASMASPQLLLSGTKQSVTTDSNGYWTVTLIPNGLITPTGTKYVVKTPARCFLISIPGGTGPFQASLITA